VIRGADRRTGVSGPVDDLAARISCVTGQAVTTEA